MKVDAALFILAGYLVVVLKAELHRDDYYAKFNKPGEDHTLTKYKGTGENCDINGNRVVAKSGPVTDEEKQVFLKVHNDFRRKVAKGLETEGSPGPQPAAADMLEVTWNNELAASAQRWAEQCPPLPGSPQLPHDKNRQTDDYTWVGQNVWKDTFENTHSSMPSLSSPDPSLSAPVQAAMGLFYKEAANFPASNVAPFQSTNDPNRPSGHYTQIVWGNTAEIGCGFFMSKEVVDRDFYELRNWRRIVVCNYGPGGNVVGTNMYTLGTPGSKCPPGTVNNDGLCARTTNSATTPRVEVQTPTTTSFIPTTTIPTTTTIRPTTTILTTTTTRRTTTIPTTTTTRPTTNIPTNIPTTPTTTITMPILTTRNTAPKITNTMPIPTTRNPISITNIHTSRTTNTPITTNYIPSSTTNLPTSRTNMPIHTTSIPDVTTNISRGKTNIPETISTRTNMFNTTTRKPTTIYVNPATTTTMKSPGCYPEEYFFQCDNFECIYEFWVCDNIPDCSDHSDENKNMCMNRVCPIDKFQCDSGRCIDKRWLCDQIVSCPGGEDETMCPW